MPARVVLESCGDHSFDLPHLRRSGGEDLIQLLLEKAGFYDESLWRVRINEKQQCSGMTPPISVVRYKEWGVYIRIKPGDNNTCHNVTLLIPNGHKAVSVFSKLKTIEKSFNRNWRKVENTVPSTIVNGVSDISVANLVTETTQDEGLLERAMSEISAEIAEESVENKRFDLQAFLANNDNIKAICLSIRSLEETTNWRDTAQFMDSLCKSLSVNLSGRQGGAMMRSMMNRGLAKKVFDGTRHTSYGLTRKGRDLIKNDLYQPKPQPQPEPEQKPVEAKVEPMKPAERANLLREIGPLAQDISQASTRLKEIGAERIECQKKLDALDKEEQEICELLDSAEIEKFLSRLVDIKLKPK